MRRKIFIFLTGSIILFAQSIPFPPMPPSFSIPKKNSVHKKEKKVSLKQTAKHKKNSLPKECELLPPMVVLIPPPMEDMLQKCKNTLYKPKKEKAEKNLQKILKKNIIVSKIESIEDFSRVYKITTKKNGIFYCNKAVTACFAGKVIK